MEKKAQLICKRNKKGDSIIQLKDGKLLFYYFNQLYYIYIYNEKTFQNLFEIDFYKLIYQFEKEKEKEKNEDKLKEKKEDNFDECDYLKKKYSNTDKNKNSIIELCKNVILIGRNNYLIELNLYKKKYDYKIVKQFENTILDINELSDKRIIAITKEKILILKREKEEYIIKKEYPIKENWKIIPLSSKYKGYGKFNQYFSSVELPDHRLLLNSFSTELEFHDTGCIRGPPTEFSNSKIIFIDTNNFEEIKSTETFKVDANHIILENYIIIRADDNTFVYDINSLNLIQNINLPGLCDLKFDNKYIIMHSIYGEKNTLKMYKIENNNFIEHCDIVSFIFEYLYFLRCNRNIRLDKSLFVMRDKKIIVFHLNKIFILQILIE